MASISESSRPSSKVEQFIQNNPKFKDRRIRLAWRGFINLVAGHKAGPKDKAIVAFLLSGKNLPERETVVYHFLNEVSRLNKTPGDTNFEKLNGLMNRLLEQDLPVLEEALNRFSTNRALVDHLNRKCASFRGDSFQTTLELQKAGQSPLRQIQEAPKKRPLTICKIILVFVLALGVALAASVVFSSIRPHTSNAIGSPFLYNDLISPVGDIRTYSTTIHYGNENLPVYTPSPLLYDTQSSHAETMSFKCDLDKN